MKLTKIHVFLHYFSKYMGILLFVLKYKYISLLLKIINGFSWPAKIMASPFNYKGIVSDSNNILSWHESEEINDHVHWHCSTDYCVKLILVNENLCKNWFYFALKWFLSLTPLGKCASWGTATNRCKKFKFWNFWECPLHEIWEYAFNLTFYR